MLVLTSPQARKNLTTEKYKLLTTAFLRVHVRVSI